MIYICFFLFCGGEGRYVLFEIPFSPNILYLHHEKRLKNKISISKLEVESGKRKESRPGICDANSQEIADISPLTPIHRGVIWTSVNIKAMVGKE